jgi:hypothetical protein
MKFKAVVESNGGNATTKTKALVMAGDGSPLEAAWRPRYG